MGRHEFWLVLVLGLDWSTLNTIAQVGLPRLQSGGIPFDFDDREQTARGNNNDVISTP